MLEASQGVKSSASCDQISRSGTFLYSPNSLISIDFLFHIKFVAGARNEAQARVCYLLVSSGSNVAPHDKQSFARQVLSRVLHSGQFRSLAKQLSYSPCSAQEVATSLETNSSFIRLSIYASLLLVS